MSIKSLESHMGSRSLFLPCAVLLWKFLSFCFVDMLDFFASPFRLFLPLSFFSYLLFFSHFWIFHDEKGVQTFSDGESSFERQKKKNQKTVLHFNFVAAYILLALVCSVFMFLWRSPCYAFTKKNIQVRTFIFSHERIIHVVCVVIVVWVMLITNFTATILGLQIIQNSYTYMIIGK
jgi:hypothetical protein